MGVHEPRDGSNTDVARFEQAGGQATRSCGRPIPPSAPPPGRRQAAPSPMAPGSPTPISRRSVPSADTDFVEA